MTLHGRKQARQPRHGNRNVLLGLIVVESGEYEWNAYVFSGIMSMAQAVIVVVFHNDSALLFFESAFASRYPYKIAAMRIALEP
jgi:hypothetical protein